MTSFDALTVEGHRTYHCRVRLAAKHFLSVHVPSNDPSTEAGCCSQHGFGYISKTLAGEANVDPGEIEDFVLDELELAGFPDNLGIAETDVIPRDNLTDPECNEVIIEDLRLDWQEAASFRVTDVRGVVVGHLTDLGTLETELAGIASGVYVLEAYTHTGAFLSARRLLAQPTGILLERTQP